MKKGYTFRRILSFLMFITSFCPWAVFLQTSVHSKPLEPGLVLLLLLAVSFFFILFQKRKYIVLFTVAAFIISVIITSSFYYTGASNPLFSIYFFPVKTLSGIFNYLLLIIFTFIIWTASFRIISRSPERDVLRIRFDSGLASFFFLMLIKLVIKVKGGDLSAYESSADWFICFIFSGFFALVIKSGSGKHLLIKSSAAVLVFFILIIAVSFSIFFFLSPELKELAFSGSGILGRAGSGFEQGLTLFIKFFLDFRYRRRVVEGGFNSSFSSGAGGPAGDVPDDVILVFQAFIALMILSAVLILLYLFVKSLIRGLNKNRDEKKSVKNDLRYLYLLFSKILNIFMMNNITPRELRYFSYLKLFGLIKGVKYNNYNTPKEYAERLSSRFKYFKDEIFLITEVHDDFLYGGITADKLRIKKAASCLKKIINPWSFLMIKNEKS